MPSQLAHGPWVAGMQHGGPPAGLLARAVESMAAEGLRPARLTVDLFRNSPMAPVEVETEVLRQGRRIGVYTARLRIEGKVTAAATALFLQPSEVGDSELGAAPLEWRSEAPVEPLFSRGVIPVQGFHSSVEARWISVNSPRPAVWIRLPMALVEGEEVSAFQRAAAISDFANALAGRARVGSHRPGMGFINADLTVHLARLPRGEWIGLQLDAHSEIDGLGLVEVTQYDRDGPFGRCLQERLANPRS